MGSLPPDDQLALAEYFEGVMAAANAEAADKVLAESAFVSQTRYLVSIIFCKICLI